MEVKYWYSGLYKHEIEAIKKIETAFSKKGHMFPWKGYAGFRFISSKGREGEFDLIIITHCNVLIIELKDWNHQPITARGDQWYKGGQHMDRSPVSITQNKKYTLSEKLKPLRHRLTNKNYPVFIEFFVVMTGNSDFSKLPETDLHHTISLDDFLKFADPKVFYNRFHPHPNAKTLNQDFAVFDELFLGDQTTAKPFRTSGYKAQELIFKHPKEIYSEYIALAESQITTTALLRIWDFDKVEDVKGKTTDGRAEIISRERQVLQYINHLDHDLYNSCLRSLTSFQKDTVTTVCPELFELPPNHVRFNEFIGKYANGLPELDRLVIAKLLIAKFAALHNLKIAHRDIHDHSLWISPTKTVALSNFISAYYQPIGTVGDFRHLLSVGAIESGNQNVSGKFALTPFEQDVQALAIIIWHLLTAQRISDRSCLNVQEELIKSDKWYAPILLDAITTNTYGSARELFDAIKRNEPKLDVGVTFDVSVLESYRHPINHSREYPVTGKFFIETDEKEVYISNNTVVKAWLNCGGITASPSESFKVYNFLQKIEKIRNVNSPYLPVIREFGIAQKSSCLYLVTDHISNGTSWNTKYPLNVVEQKLDETEKEKIIHDIEQLVNAIESLHEYHIYHGDLHGDNIIFDGAVSRFYLIDIPDFSLSGGEPQNTRYSPEIEGVSALQRDNYAVIKLSCEILGIKFGEISEQYPLIAEAIKTELEDRTYGFKDIARFKQALHETKSSIGKKLIKVFSDRFDEDVIIYPENGQLYVKAEINPHDEKSLWVTFTGIGGTYILTYYPENKRFTSGMKPRLRNSISSKEKADSQFEISQEIHLIKATSRDFSLLDQILRENESFQRAINLILETSKETKSLENNLVIEKIEEVVIEEEEDLPFGFGDFENKHDSKNLISTQDLWRAILDTEIESSPNIEISSEPYSLDGDIVFPYVSDNDPLENFDGIEKVFAVTLKPDLKSDKSEADGNSLVEYRVGEVNFKKSGLNEIRLSKVRNLRSLPQEGDIIFFRSQQSNASLRKRKFALERLLERRSVIPQLVDLFDPDFRGEATRYWDVATSEDFKRYDRTDGNGHKISLNGQQRQAFNTILRNGPLSLLQGPPGTGKTEFIAAFVHYLVEKLNVKNILLVSQSHEAVNNAAERIRKHCERLNTTLEVVRFSNREGAVSNGLKDVYSHAITNEKRELFIAELKYRIQALSTAIGLDAEYMMTVVQAELVLFKQIDELKQLEKTHQKLLEDSKEVKKQEFFENISQSIQALELNIRNTLASIYQINLTADETVNSNLKEIVIQKLSRSYNVSPDEINRVKALAKLSTDMVNTLSGQYVNYDEFYARSRQLVTGTCVGIGQGHIGVRENIYDWVIIDEAARSQSSELAIAMQSGKRVLLVGDHLQLPPLYSKEHKQAIARYLGINDLVKDDFKKIDDVLKSDFDRAFNSRYGKSCSASLLTQYRMATPIGNMVSDIFYEGKLESADRIISDIYIRKTRFMKSIVTWIDTSDMGRKANHTERNGSLFNQVEATTIISMLKQLSEDTDLLNHLNSVRKGDAAIGVICMYGEQKRYLRQLFNQQVWHNGFKELVKIDTVDSYQGKENRIIIVSVGRSDNIKSVGFLDKSNRINVAMSRAMDRLFIVGNKEMWKGRNQKMPLGDIISYIEERGETPDYCSINSKEIKGQ